MNTKPDPRETDEEPRKPTMLVSVLAVDPERYAVTAILPEDLETPYILRPFVAPGSVEEIIKSAVEVLAYARAVGGREDTVQLLVTDGANGYELASRLLRTMSNPELAPLVEAQVMVSREALKQATARASGSGVQPLRMH